MRLLTFILVCLNLRPAPHRRAAIATLLLFAVGAAAAMSFLVPSFHAPGVTVFAALLTGVAVLARGTRALPLRLGAGALLLGVHAIWTALAIAFGSVLAWAVPAWQWAAIAGAAAAYVVTALRGTALRVPLALPVGLMIAAAAASWMREDGLVHCDDYLRLRAAGVTLAVPSTPEIAHCRPGEILIVDRYPRQFWEAPNGDTFLVTSQRGDHDYSLGRGLGRRVPVFLSGAICAVRDGEAVPQCIGEGKADGVADAPVSGRLYVTSHDGDRTFLSILPRDGTVQPLAQVELPMKAGLFFFDEGRDLFGLSEDESRHVYLMRASDLQPLRTVIAPIVVDQMRYDPQRNEGIICASGSAGLPAGRYPALAFTAEPFAYRPLALSSRYPTSWVAATWGCDWDPVGRRAWVAIASLGLLQEIDYDTGAVLRSIFIGPGARPVVFDARRQLVYVAFFLEGTVLALDAGSGRQVASWPAGHFVRSLALSRDGTALFAASTLGVVRIPLPAVAG